MKRKVFDYKRKAKPISYGATRPLSSITGIVIHYTGNVGDSAKNNCDFFALRNTRSAGAHIFIDALGYVGLSIPMRRIAWSVGNPGGSYFPGAYYNVLNNSNTVSIELCDIVDHGVTPEQLDSLIHVCRWIKKKCPKVEHVVRHYDIVKKCCPQYYVENRPEWKNLQRKLERAIGIRG